MLIVVVYIVASCAGLAILSLSLATLVRPNFQFWPPPSASSWQHATFRWLFRVFFVGVVSLSVLTANTPLPLSRYAIGALLLVLGFGLALKWTNVLRWRIAFGEAEGLKTDGVYRWSRNPIYVVSIIGMIGWGKIADSW